MGRKKKENGRTRNIHARLNEEEYSDLEYLRTVKGLSYSDILRDGIRMQKNLARYSEK